MRNFDLSKTWHTIATHSDQIDRQALATVLESVAVTAYKMGFLMLLATVVFVLLTVRKWQSSPLKMYYQPSSSLWPEVFNQTGLLKMKYKPSIWTLHPFTQLFWFSVMSAIEMIRKPIKYRRQIFELADGGELAIDWL